MWVLGLVGERHMITRSLCREGGWSVIPRWRCISYLISSVDCTVSAKFILYTAVDKMLLLGCRGQNKYRIIQTICGKGHDTELTVSSFEQVCTSYL